MYQSHWQLQRKPFDAGADPQFYYPAQAHQAALLKLRYAVESRRGASMLAGPLGCGKTLLVAMLRQALGREFAPLVHLVFPQMSAPELLGYVAAELCGSPAADRCGSVSESVRQIERLLGENARQGRHAGVVVDEAHLLDDPSALEALRLLLNFESGGQPGLTLLLAGQTALVPILQRTPQLDQRLSVKCVLRPFTAEETAGYVQHRLQVAGATRPIFDAAALAAVHQLTHGVARRINRLCDLALLIAYAEGQHAVTTEQLEAVQEELVTVSAE